MQSLLSIKIKQLLLASSKLDILDYDRRSQFLADGIRDFIINRFDAWSTEIDVNVLGITPPRREPSNNLE